MSKIFAQTIDKAIIENVLNRKNIGITNVLWMVHHRQELAAGMPYGFTLGISLTVI